MIDDLDPELLKKAEEVVASHRSVRAESASARVSFHEKLAVLAAGSLAIAVTAAGALYQRPLQNAIMTHMLLSAVALSAVLLWFSLVASIMHNFLEASALHLDTRLEFHRGTRQLFKAIVQTSDVNRLGEADSALAAKVINIAEAGLLENEHRSVRQAERARAWGMPLSIAAIALFSLGYLCIVLYILVLAIRFH